LPKPGIIHIDCDLYISTISVLKFLKPLLVSGSILLFDDYYCYPANQNLGQKKAIDEFLKNNKDYNFKSVNLIQLLDNHFFLPIIRA
jgi:O-methyltransferase